MYFKKKYKITGFDLEAIQQKACKWASHFNHFALYNASLNPIKYGGFGNFLVADALNVFNNENQNWNELKSNKNKWLCGSMGYNLKNYFENLNTPKQALHTSYDFYFFEPKYLIFFHSDEEIEIHTFGEDVTESVFNAIFEQELTYLKPLLKCTPIGALETMAEYIEKVNQIKNLIFEGVVYEINYCTAFEQTYQSIDAIALYFMLNAISPAPFSGIFQTPELIIVCASPERYLKKIGNQLIAQPIKGTIARKNLAEDDEIQRNILLNSTKDRAENMMIVDLVRSDLAKVSEVGSVKVEEMFGIYSFPQVHQMISTIISKIKADKDIFHAIESSYPMGSMTGAPKVSAMKCIDRLETINRGFFSGSFGWINPDGEADFNVLIRTIFIDKIASKLNYFVGSAITYDSEPEQEYEECMLKAKAIVQTLTMAQS